MMISKIKTKTTRIYLLRHGKVNGAPALYGRTNIEVAAKVNTKILNQLNKFQQKSNHKITHVITSPLQRCNKVAKQFALHNELTLDEINNFQEMNFGQLDGQSFDDIQDDSHGKQIWQQLENFWHDPSKFPLPQAEILSHFYERVYKAWQKLITEHAGKNILLVCHGGVIRMILAYILGLDYQNKSLFSQLAIKNSSTTIVKYITELSANKQHSQVITVSTPLKVLSKHPKEFE